MMNLEKMSLDELCQLFLERNARRLSDAWTNAEVVVAIKAHFSDNKEWLKCVQERLGLRDRQSYNCQNAVALRRKLEELAASETELHHGAVLELINTLPFRHVVELTRLPEVQQIERLAAEHDLKRTSRDELRALVDAALGKTKPQGEASIKFPPPEQLLLAFDSDENYRKLSCSDALVYGTHFVFHAFNKAKASKNPNKHSDFMSEAFLSLSKLAKEALSLLSADERRKALERLSAE